MKTKILAKLKICISVPLTVLDVKSIYFLPQSGNLTAFTAPISATSDLDLLDFKPKKDENM